MSSEPKMNARSVLWYLVFVGFAVNYMIRINMNITIVTMVKPPGVKKSLTKSSMNANRDNHNISVIQSGHHQTRMYACYVERNTSNLADVQSSVRGRLQYEPKVKSPEILLLHALQYAPENDGFEWNEYEQGLVLGAFFWLHWITQVPGGILARKYGTKLVFGLSNAIGCWLCFLMPLASYLDLRIIIFLRVIQGLIVGVAWPAMHHMAGQWIPPNERSKFVTAYLGSSVGIALNFPLFGYIISWTSWEYVFHFCGIFGTVWYIAWKYLVYDSPADHPWIHPKEREYIESSLGIPEKSRSEEHQRPTPWRKMVFSRPMWINIIAQWAGIWGLFTLMTQAPSYFNYIHGWGIKMTGILSGIPHLCRMVFAYFFSWIGDYLLQHNLMSRTNVRKMGGALCCSVKGIFVLALAYSGCNATAAILFLTLATMVHGAVSTGPLANMIDMSPKYAGILLGISGMITVIPGFVSPIIVGILTLGNQTVQQWQYVFLISASMLIAGGIMYILFADSTLQSWNSSDHLDVMNGRELETLKANFDDAVPKDMEAAAETQKSTTAEVTENETESAQTVLVR
ncbi:sialin [Malaya genurostris]|uniref:sialin n=1 Tax=Malaya genurostris TaxID=325434 RepID=UPI0026F40626|nr:sialin [Malaya genurostris]